MYEGIIYCIDIIYRYQYLHRYHFTTTSKKDYRIRLCIPGGTNNIIEVPHGSSTQPDSEILVHVR